MILSRYSVRSWKVCVWLLMFSLVVRMTPVPLPAQDDFELPDARAGEEEAWYPCPPRIKAVYVDPGLGYSFFGVAEHRMKQWNGVHTYQYTGYSVDGLWKITGFGHVPSSQCIAAYYAWLRGITVTLVTLHFAELTYLGRADSGCGGEADNVAEDLSYDPYAPEEPTRDCGDGATGTSGPGPEGGTGTQYNPGDNTGGETVDWTTGRGNGGQSVCGDNAVVVEICIDVWDEEKEEWVEWSCGYATAC